MLTSASNVVSKSIILGSEWLKSVAEIGGWLYQQTKTQKKVDFRSFNQKSEGKGKSCHSSEIHWLFC